MRIVCVGGGPGGLFFARLAALANPDHDVSVVDRDTGHERAGAGIVLSEATVASIATWDPTVHQALLPRLVHWDTIEVRRDAGGSGRPARRAAKSAAPAVVRSTGHAFRGVSRRALLDVLASAAHAAGVRVERGREETSHASLADADLVVAADGAASTLRAGLGSDAAVHTDTRANRFLWLDTAHVFRTFRFLFRADANGLWRVHAYPHAAEASTVVVECSEPCWRVAGMDARTPDESAAWLSRLLADELGGHALRARCGPWQRFTTVRVAPWWHERLVLLGDAAHTAHFSIGSGTRLALEDAVALRDALSAHPRLCDALAAYDDARRPAVEAAQRAAQASLEWFEHAERYAALDNERFAFSLLTRSLRVTHADLQHRDPALTEQIDRLVALDAERQVAAALDVPTTPPTARARSKPDGVEDEGRPGAGEATAPPRTPPPMFTPFRLRGLVLGNRVVVSPMCQYSAVDGAVGDWHLMHLGALANGGAGLVVAEMTAVSDSARITAGCAGLYTDAHVGAWRRVTDFIHRETRAAVGVQLGHAGRKGATLRPWEGEQTPMPDGWPLIAPSPIAFLPGRTAVPREMTRADMDQVRADFAAATTRAAAAGFDLLELHMAHGYLLASFISPLTNHRTDAHGGALANRLRFPLEVFDACRAAWPNERPMSVRISATDWAPGGLAPEEAVDVARLLRAHGCDAVDVSTGQTVATQRPEHGRLFQTPFAERLRFEAGVATMAVGGISSFADVNTIIAAGRADLCLLARGHLFDPYWTRHAAAAQGWALPWPAPYLRADSYRPR